MKLDKDRHVVFLEDMEQDSDEWLHWRQQGLGSSDIALIMSPKPVFDRSLVTLWRDRTGIEPHPFVANEHTIRGKTLEPAIRESVNQMLNMDFEPVCVYREDAPYLRASLDGYSREHDCILEIKSPSDRVFDKYMQDWQVPENYMYQMQYQMLVCGAEYGWFAFYNETRPHPYLIYVPNDLEMQSEIERRASLLWHAIERRVPIGFVDEELTLLPQVPTMFVLIGGAEAPLPVEKLRNVRSFPHSFAYECADYRDIAQLKKLNPAHRVELVCGEASNPFSPN